MDASQVFGLAILQGLTEFLPISSTAHLILVPVIAAWPDQGRAFDVALHVGILVAVVSYFRSEVGAMAIGWWRSVSRRETSPEGRLAWLVMVGTIPVGLCGLALTAYDGAALRAAGVIAGATIGFALLLWWADRRGTRVRSEYSLRLRDVLLIGGAQAFALIPGTSRSGVTMTAGLALGLTRNAAARFSFLLAIPVIALAGGLESVQALRAPDSIDWAAFALGAAVSGGCAYATIHFFLRLLDRIGLLPFVIYRLVLGVVLLAFVV